jgi:hypothetical protein
MTHPHARNRSRFAAWAVLTALTTGTLAGCSSEQIPPEEKEAINTGVNVEVGSLAAYNMLIISSAEGEPGRLLGVLMTSSADPMNVTFADDNEEITIAPRAETGSEQQHVFRFEEHKHLFDTTEARPGALATITVSADGESQEVKVPVYDGTFERYRPFLPEG